MLKKVQDNKCRQASVSLGEAGWPAPFLSGLEYNSPAHGNWNIVHIGMLVPESHQIYVCAGGCNRGVAMTAAEMGAMDRFSFIEVREEDLFNGSMEGLITEGVGHILDRLPKRPRAVFLFLVCIHRFMGLDIPWIYQTLRERHPDVVFMEGYMDCIMQKEDLSPDQQLRIHMLDALSLRKRNPDQVSLIGSDFPLRPSSEIMRILDREGKVCLDMAALSDFEDYLSMGDSALNICTYPLGQPGLKILSDRLGIPGLYLPMTYDYDRIDRQLALLTASLTGADGGTEEKPGKAPGEWMDTARLRDRCRESLKETADLLGDRELALDASATPQVLGLARFLISEGIRVRHIYADAFLPEEEEDYLWLKDRVPGLRLHSVIHPARRVLERIPDPAVLAVGQKAAYFHQTPHYVNMVEGGGLHGYDGILCLLEKIREAARTERELHETIGRKGLGGPCILQ